MADFKLKCDGSERTQVTLYLDRSASATAKFLRSQLQLADRRWPGADVWNEETLQALARRVAEKLMR